MEIKMKAIKEEQGSAHNTIETCDRGCEHNYRIHLSSFLT